MTAAPTPRALCDACRALLAESGVAEAEVQRLLRRACRQAWDEGYHASNVDACMNAEFGTARRSRNPYDEAADEVPPGPGTRRAS
ncbi:hypothetical protein V4F30_24450 [Rhodococcus sp. IITD102]|uniref:hypothetical protein n=1 Tax=Rhodococcus sp. IITD102 TaxID=3119531 RepID=UPI002FC30FB9